ncbi:MAG: JAB domain-containing protein, partial [Cyclobacteriaceae bacterium]
MTLYERGTASLSNQHIVSSIAGISMETARQILKKAESIENLASWNINNFMQFTGVGINKAAALVSAFELGRRRTFSNSGTRHTINSSKDAYDYVRPYLLDQEIEQFYCLLLNRANRIIKAELISSGGTSGTVVDAKIVFKIALEFKASALILAHNHP